tara:strand:- start:3261 stop:3740 length:480 start_codon:yes stop_codon:yes gene_type:complete
MKKYLLLSLLSGLTGITYIYFFITEEHTLFNALEIIVFISVSIVLFKRYKNNYSEKSVKNTEIDENEEFPDSKFIEAFKYLWSKDVWKFWSTNEELIERRDRKWKKLNFVQKSFIVLVMMLFFIALGGIINSSGLTGSSEFTHFLDGALFDDLIKPAKR